MKIFAYSAIAFCLLCHHHLFHRHAKACGGCGGSVAVQSFAVPVQSFAVQSFAVPVQSFAVQSFAVPTVAVQSVAVPNVVIQSNVVAQPRRQVVRQRTVIRN